MSPIPSLFDVVEPAKQHLVEDGVLVPARRVSAGSVEARQRQPRGAHPTRPRRAGRRRQVGTRSSPQSHGHGTGRRPLSSIRAAGPPPRRGRHVPRAGRRARPAYSGDPVSSSSRPLQPWRPAPCATPGRPARPGARRAARSTRGRHGARPRRPTARRPPRPVVPTVSMIGGVQSDGGPEREHLAEVPAGLGGPRPVGLVDHEQVGDLEEPGLGGLERVAPTGGDHHHRGVAGRRHLDLDLADPDRLDHHHRKARRAEDPDARRGRPGPARPGGPGWPSIG